MTQRERGNDTPGRAGCQYYGLSAQKVLKAAQEPTAMRVEHIDERAFAVRRGRLLEYITIVWNSAEGIVSIGAGLLAGSIALIGFRFRLYNWFHQVLRCLASALYAPERRERAESTALKWSVLASYCLLLT